jgi:Berberine and berberine like
MYDPLSVKLISRTDKTLVTTTVMFMLQGPQATEANLKAALAPFFTATSKFAGIKTTTPLYSSYKSYKAWFDHEFNMDAMMKRRSLTKRDPIDGVAQPNGLTQLDSRILGARHFKSTNLAAALKAAMPSGPLGQLRGNMVSGLGVAALASNSETSVNPAWRSGLTHLIASGIPGAWNVDSLRTLAPDSGAYANEASWNQTNWKTAFWGENYSKLSAIKTKYDAKNVLWATPGINADHLVVKDGRLCTVTGTPNANVMTMNTADRGTMAPANDNLNQNTDPENDEGSTTLALMPWNDVIAHIMPSADDD